MSLDLARAARGVHPWAGVRARTRVLERWLLEGMRISACTPRTLAIGARSAARHARAGMTARLPTHAHQILESENTQSCVAGRNEERED